MIKHIPRILIACLMISLITLSILRYKADIHFCAGRRLSLERSFDECLIQIEKATRLNPFVINYSNVLALVYLNRGIEGLGVASEHSKAYTAKMFVNAIYTAGKVQRLYPEEYYSASILKRAYIVLHSLSRDDMSKYIVKYNKIVIKARPYREKVQ